MKFESNGKMRNTSLGVSGFLLNTAPETIISKDITQVLHEGPPPLRTQSSNRDRAGYKPLQWRRGSDFNICFP